jgi:hypothetical protein
MEDKDTFTTEEVSAIFAEVEEVTNKVRDVFEGRNFGIIMTALSRISGEMIYDMQETPSDEGAEDLLNKLQITTRAAYAMAKYSAETREEDEPLH